MLIIGLTGNSGSGKSYVASLFEKKGIPSIDTDAIVHRLYEDNPDCINKLKSVYGDSIILPDGTVNRKALADIVFSDSEYLRILNEIVHGFVRSEVQKKLNKFAEQNKTAVIIDAPLLFESGLDKECDLTMAVIADEGTKVERITKRDKITPEKAILRLKNQKSNEFFREKCKFIISNNGNDNPEDYVNQFIEKYIYTKRRLQDV